MPGRAQVRRREGRDGGAEGVPRGEDFIRWVGEAGGGDAGQDGGGDFVPGGEEAGVGEAGGGQGAGDEGEGEAF